MEKPLQMESVLESSIFSDLFDILYETGVENE